MVYETNDYIRQTRLRKKKKIVWNMQELALEAIIT